MAHKMWRNVYSFAVRTCISESWNRKLHSSELQNLILSFRKKRLKDNTMVNFPNVVVCVSISEMVCIQYVLFVFSALSILFLILQNVDHLDALTWV